MSELEILNKVPLGYLSSSDAGARYKVTGDYVARLCRQGKVEGMLVGRTWYVSDASLRSQLGLAGVAPAPVGPAGLASIAGAASASGLSQSYITKLCRQQKIKAQLVGGLWFVDEASLREYARTSEAARTARQEELASSRKQEYAAALPLKARASAFARRRRTP